MSDIFSAEDFIERSEELESWPIRVCSYKLKGVYVCEIDNVSPGATIARGRGETREAAESMALSKAARHLAKTVRRAV